MTTAAYAPGVYAPTPWPDPPWRRWVDEVGMPVVEAAGRAALLLLQLSALLVYLGVVVPGRAGWRLLRRARYGTGEAVVCSVVFAGPVALLVRTLPLVRWPSPAEAVADLQQAAVVAGVAYLVVVVGFVQGASGPRGVGPRALSTVDVCGKARAYAPGPKGGRTNTRRWHIAVHEAGHLVVGRVLGRRTGWARITGPSSGRTWVDVNSRDPIGEIAIDMAGGYAAGSWQGCGADQAHAHHRLRRVPQRRRAEYMRRGHALSSRKVRENRSEIVRVAGHIYDKGKFRY